MPRKVEKVLFSQRFARPKCTFMKGRREHGRGASAGVDDAARGARRGVLLLAAFAAGFAVTGIEIALGRLLAPHFGGSLTVWASIIAAVIAALAIGYPLGGALADRRPGPLLPLGALCLGGVLGAALGIALPIWLRGAMAGIGLNGAAYWLRLSTVLLLFAVPCMLLACVPPSVLRLTLRARDTSGRDAGLLYALGSVGSVLGVLLPALWWIPFLGVRTTFLLIGLIAVLPVVSGLCCGMLAWTPRLRFAVLGPLLLLALLPATVQAPASSSFGEVLFEADSGLQRVRVVARDTPRFRRRWLMFNEGWSSHSALLEPYLVTRDVWDWMALTALLPRPDDGRTDVLIVGLAGGTVSNLMTRWLRPLLPGLAITGVEIDPVVIDVADRYLALDRSHLRTVAADGRVWLRGSDQRFDLILLDAYRQPSIPAHLATVEFFAEVRDRLAPGGIAVVNAFAPAGSSAVFAGLASTWDAVFPGAQLFVGPAKDGFASHLLFGGPGLPLDYQSIAPVRIPVPLRAGWQRLRSGTRFLELGGDASVPWTDDRVPVELLTERAFRSTRPPNAPLRQG
jgi:spermidine synthase